jgi:hypothetical protein
MDQTNLIYYSSLKLNQEVLIIVINLFISKNNQQYNIE